MYIHQKTNEYNKAQIMTCLIQGAFIRKYWKVAQHVRQQVLSYGIVLGYFVRDDDTVVETKYLQRNVM
jgi:hypothetical protein